MADVVIGRIAVKVTPDTSDFRADAKRDLERIEKQLDPIKIKTALDTGRLKEQAEKAQAEVRRSLKDVSIRVNLRDAASLQAAIARVRHELDRLGETRIPLAVDEKGLREQLKGFQGDLDKVARLHLKVDPQSEQSLQRAIKQIDAELAKRRELDVNVKLDKASLEATRAELARRLQTQIDAKVALDNASFAKVRAEIDAFTRSIRINPKLDDREVQAKLREIERVIEEVNGKRIELQAQLSERDKRRVEHEINDLQDKLNDLKASIEVDIKNGSREKARLSLLALARDRTVKLIPEISSTAAARVAATLAAFSGARVANELLENLWDSVKNLDKAAPLIGSLATAVAGLGSVGIASASSLASLAASLASIGPAALALPGIFGGLAVGVIASVVALKDINKHLPEFAIGLGKAQKAGEAWTTLQDKMSAVFWKGFEQPLRNLLTSLFPQFSAGMVKISGELGVFFGGLATGLNGAFNGALAGMFNDLSASIRIATGATGGLTNIVKILGETGAGYLPRLAQWFVTITNNFSAFLSRAQGSGALTQWINTAIEALKQLGSVVVSVGSILYGLGKAADAAGGSTLATLADTLQHVATVVNSSGFQASLVGVFAAAHAAINAIVTQAGPALERFFTSFANSLQMILPMAGDAIGKLLAAIADALAQPAFQRGLTDVFVGIQSAAQSLAPALGPLGQALGAIGSLLGVFLTTLAPNIAAILTTLAQAFSVLAPALQPVVELLGKGLAGAIQLVAPLITNLVNGISSLTSGNALGGLAGFAQQMTAAWQPLIPLLGSTVKGLFQDLIPVFQAVLSAGQQIGPALGQALQPIIAALGPALGQLGGAVGTLVNALAPLVATILPPLGQILGALVGVIGTVVAALAPFIAQVIQIASAIIGPLVQALAPIIAQFLPQLGQAFTNLASALTPVLNILQTVANWIGQYVVPALAQLVSLVLDNVITVINAVVGVIQGAVKIIQGAWDILAGIFTGDWSRVWHGVQEIFSGVWTAIVALFKGIVGLIVNIFTDLTANARAKWSELWNGIQSVASTVWNWLTSTWRSITSSITSTASAAWNTITSAFAGFGSSLKATATAAWNAVKSAFTTGVNAAVSLVESLPSRAASALANIGSVLLNAGKNLINGFIDGIKAKFNEVKNLLNSLTSLLPDWKGPASRDRVLLYDAGQFVMDGFLNGLESRYHAVRKSLSGLTREVGGMSVEAPGVAARLTSSVTGALDGSTSIVTQKILNYYAAPGSNIDAEEDLFAATDRARMVGW